MTSPPITRDDTLQGVLDRFGGTKQDGLSPIENVLYAAYQFKGSEVFAIELPAQKRAIEAYRSEITRLIADVGCTGQANLPSGTQRATLLGSVTDGISGAMDNFNNALKKQIQQAVAANPKGRRSEFKGQLDAWSKRRLTNMSSLIVTSTRNSASAYASQQFKVNNQLTSERYVYEGRHPNGQKLLPTSSAECIARVAAKDVDYAYVQANPVPNHPRCPHKWQLFSSPNVDCKQVWRG
jgi:hypothetical protein